MKLYVFAMNECTILTKTYQLLFYTTEEYYYLVIPAMSFDNGSVTMPPPESKCNQDDLGIDAHGEHMSDTQPVPSENDTTIADGRAGNQYIRGTVNSLGSLLESFKTNSSLAKYGIETTAGIVHKFTPTTVKTQVCIHHVEYPRLKCRFLLLPLYPTD